MPELESQIDENNYRNKKLLSQSKDVTLNQKMLF